MCRGIGLWGTKLHLTILEVYMNLVYPKTYSIDLPFCRGLSHQSDLGKWVQTSSDSSESELYASGIPKNLLFGVRIAQIGSRIVNL